MTRRGLAAPQPPQEPVLNASGATEARTVYSAVTGLAALYVTLRRGRAAGSGGGHRASGDGDPLTGRAAVVLNPRATSRVRAGTGTLSLEGWCLCPGILDSLGPLHAPNVTGLAATSGKQKSSTIPTSVRCRVARPANTSAAAGVVSERRPRRKALQAREADSRPGRRPRGGGRAARLITGTRLPRGCQQPGKSGRVALGLNIGHWMIELLRLISPC